MNKDIKGLIDALETAKTHAGAEMEKACNNDEPQDAYIFLVVKDSIEVHISLLNYLYNNCKEESEG